MSSNIFPFAQGPAGRNIMVDSSGFLVASADFSSSGLVYGVGSAGRPLVVDSSGRLLLSSLSPGLGGGGGGESNTASNVGSSGVGLFKQKSGVDLQFKKLVAGSNVTFVQSADSIRLIGTDTGEANTASNLGTGSGVFSNKSGVDLRFKSMEAGPGVALSGTANALRITTSPKNQEVTLTDAPTVATDASRGTIFTLSTSFERTLGAPTNPSKGQRAMWVVNNTASSGITLTLDTGTGGFAFGSTINTLSDIAAGKKDIIGAYYNGNANKWYVVAYVKGF